MEPTSSGHPMGSRSVSHATTTPDNLQTVHYTGKYIGGDVRLPHDRGRTDAQGEEEGKNHMRGLRKGDDGGVARLPPHDATRGNWHGQTRPREGKAGTRNKRTGWISPRGGQRSAQSKGARGGQGRRRRCACTYGGGTCEKLSSSWRRETSPIQDTKTLTCLYCGGPSMAAIRAQ